MAELPENASWTQTGRTWLGALGVLAVGVLLVWSAGPPGALAGLAIAVLWYVAPPPYVVAVGHVLALPLLPAPSVDTLVGLEAGFFALLAAPMVRERDWPPKVALTGLLTAGLATVAWLGWAAWQPRWLVALALVALVAIGVYGAHRYVIVAIELHGGDPSP